MKGDSGVTNTGIIHYEVDNFIFRTGGRRDIHNRVESFGNSLGYDNIDGLCS